MKLTSQYQRVAVNKNIFQLKYWPLIFYIHRVVPHSKPSAFLKFSILISKNEIKWPLKSQRVSSSSCQTMCAMKKKNSEKVCLLQKQGITFFSYVVYRYRANLSCKMSISIFCILCIFLHCQKRKGAHLRHYMWEQLFN